MVAGSYSDYRAAKMIAEQEDATETLREITTIGLPGISQ
jgi:hypothetical protein